MPRSGTGPRPRTVAGRGEDEGEELQPRPKAGKGRAPPPPDIEAPADGGNADKLREQALALVESHKKTSKRVYYCTIGLLLLGVVIVVLVDVRKKATGKNGHRLRVPKGI